MENLNEMVVNNKAEIDAIIGTGEKYLAFKLGDQEFGINLLNVKEIISLVEITEVPHTPEYVKGIINLRGTIVPVMDLRTKLGMSEIGYTERTCIIVIADQEQQTAASMSIAVDFVSEVLSIPEERISDPPKMGDESAVEYISGIAKIGSSIKILLNIDKVLKDDKLKGVLEQISQAASV